MTRPQWFSQRFRPDGGISAEGLLNQLGRPALSSLTVLVRESAQNSWDARAEDVVDYRVDLGMVSAAAVSTWRDLLGANMPAGDPGNFPLRAALRKPTIRYLAVSDRGTAGLGGPTRSDAPTREGENRNWLSFVLNSGDKQDSQGGGGTYGYGKGAFFQASRVGSVLIYSRFRDTSGLRTRLIGSTLVRSYNFQDVPFTGRHWWGAPAEEHCDPLEDVDAEEAARRLGLPAFSEGETGTTIVVVDPDLTDPRYAETEAEAMETPEAARYIADAIAWNLWPLTLSHRKKRMTVAVTANGVRVPVPSEESDPTLAAFATAYRKATSPEARVIRCGRPRAVLGAAGDEVTFGAFVESTAAQEHELDGAPHHFALMRNPDLVVAYIAGPAKQNPQVGYVGVFKVASQLDPVFAASEPPTHDAWVDSQLKGTDATYVRVARTRVKELADELAGVRSTAAQTESVAVGSLSQRLGHLVSGPGGTGALSGLLTSSSRPSGSRTTAEGGRDDGGVRHPGDGTVSSTPDSPAGTTPRGRVQLLDDPTWDIVADRYVLRQAASLTAGTYRAFCRVVTGEGAHESASPLGAETPIVYAWRSGNRVIRGDTYAASGAETVDVIIEPVQDVAFDILVELLP